MSLLVQYAALFCVVAGLASAAVTVVVTRDGPAALRIALDFWVAASLLRLSLAVEWRPLLVAAAIMAVRQLVVRSLRRPPVRFADLLGRRSSRRPDDA